MFAGGLTVFVGGALVLLAIAINAWPRLRITVAR